MGVRAAVGMLVLTVGVVGCDRSDEPPLPPTVPEAIPPEPETEGCGDLVDPALGLVQGQLDALAGAGLDEVLAGTPPELADLVPRNEELAARAASLCGAGELEGLVAARLGELRAVGPLASRYLELLAEDVGG